MTPELTALAAQALEASRRTRMRIATAESCTGGLIAACLTAIPGSSDVFDRSFVTYSNAAKVEMLGVPRDVIEAHGAVSEETALAMARGAWERLGGGAAVSVTGIAGPGGGSAEKPVGLVYIGVAAGAAGSAPSYAVRRCEFGDIGRTAVREASANAALRLLLDTLEAQPDWQA
ncbi:MAG: CinA family protein [Hyphomicrobiales bacterium]|nr:CinA family protein [Hyphomicrobiales bacterium]